MSEAMLDQISRALEVAPADVFKVDGLLDLNDLWDIVKIPGHPELRDHTVHAESRSRGCSPTRTTSRTSLGADAQATTSCSTTPTTRS